MDQLVSAAWLADHISDSDLVVLDCTVKLGMGPEGFVSTSGEAEWADAHIPGAGFADLTTDLCDQDSPLGFAVPSPDAFCEAMGRLGVGDGSRVVLYDDAQSMWAARVWWMLRWVGFDDAAILDGGMQAWRAGGHPVSDEAVQRAPAVLTPDPRPELIADKQEVLASVGDGSTCLIDSLPEAMYRGEIAPYRRPGHIPGALNAPAMDLVDADTGCFLPVETLAKRFPGDTGSRTITYCGGGIAASSDAFVLTMLGYDDVAVYTASLQEWAEDPEAPLVTDD